MSSSTSETTPSFSSTTLVLPVIDPAQLEVLLPLDSSSPLPNEFSHSSSSSRMQTRLQTSAISRKNYVDFLATLPELQTL